jgi:hypothetical protein
MKRRQIVGIANAVLVIGLAVSVIGLVAVFSAPENPAAIGRLGGPGAPVTVSPDPLPAAPVVFSGGHMDQDDRRDQGDARLYLRDAAAAAHRYPWAGAWQGETRTDLWVNAPRFSGSTSPPEASPANLSVEQ